MPFDYSPILTPPQVNPANFLPDAIARQYGVGLALPPTQVNSGQWLTNTGKARIEQDMLVCLATPVNRRLGQADYGSELPYEVFSEMTQVGQMELQSKTRDALEKWVPQVAVVKVTCSSVLDPLTNSNAALIIVQYNIKGTGIVNNLALIGGNDGVQFAPEYFTVNGLPIIQP